MLAFRTFHSSSCETIGYSRKGFNAEFAYPIFARLCLIRLLKIGQKLHHDSITKLYGEKPQLPFQLFYTTRWLNRPAVVPIGFPIGEDRWQYYLTTARFFKRDLGELHLAGRQLSPGYWNAPQITKDRFVQYGQTRWYRTGDLVRAVSDDGFHYAGRTDHQVKIQGYRVELAEIEAALRAEFNARITAVVTLPADENGIVPGCAAYVVSEVFETKELQERLKARLPSYMVPKYIAFLDTVPFNSNGKVDYPELRKPNWLKHMKAV